MTVYNRIDGGINKITLNGKPPKERMDLIEVESIIRNRVVGIKSFVILTREKEEYYINIPSKLNIFKGNPYKGWTQIFSEENSSVYGSLGASKYNPEDGSLTLITYSSNSIYIYRIKDRLITLEKRLSLRSGKITHTFILNNTIYLLAFYNNIHYLYKNEIGAETLTDITNNLEIEAGASLSLFEHPYECTTYKNKRYQARGNGKNVKILEFDGERIRIAKEIEAEFEVYNVRPDQWMGCSDSEIYYSIISDDISTDSAVKRKYKLIDKDFNTVQEGETLYNITKDFFIINNTFIARETLDAKDYAMVEFPIKAYIEKR